MGKTTIKTYTRAAYLAWVIDTLRTHIITHTTGRSFSIPEWNSWGSIECLLYEESVVLQLR